MQALLARHLEWASTTPEARNEAFNVVNGDVFRWSWMWGRLADWFGARACTVRRHGASSGRADGRRCTGPGPSSRHGTDWSSQISGASLRPGTRMPISAAAIEVVTDMSKSRRLGFLDYQATDIAFFDLFTRLRASRSSRDVACSRARRSEAGWLNEVQCAPGLIRRAASRGYWALPEAGVRCQLGPKTRITIRYHDGCLVSGLFPMSGSGAQLS